MRVVWSYAFRSVCVLKVIVASFPERVLYHTEGAVEKFHVRRLLRAEMKDAQKAVARADPYKNRRQRRNLFAQKKE